MTAYNVINGTVGDDALAGTGGIDSFVVTASFGNDSISGFTAGTDQIDLSAFYTGTFADFWSNVAYVGGDTVITLGGGTITLTGVDKYTLGENDFLFGSTTGADTLAGAAGADTLNGNAGNDTLKGGDGDDTLIGGAGADELRGGQGIDTADYATSTSGVTVNLWGAAGSGGDAAGDTLFQIENLAGSAYDDNLYGSMAGNTISGGAGADVVLAGPGADTLDGGDGDDTIAAGSGDDILLGGNGADRLEGQTGNDTLTGGGGDDSFVYRGSFGADTITDFVAGALSVDKIDLSGYGLGTFADLMTSTVDVGGNAEITVAGGGTITLTGVLKADLHKDDFVGLVDTASTGSDELLGTAGADALDAQAGDDVLWGLDGDDTLTGGAGADVLHGGNGTDTASYAASAAGVTVNLSGNAGTGGDAAGDTLFGIENITGSAFNDTLYGNIYDNVLDGGAGDDRIYGGPGDDTITGGAGNDVLVGGSGADTMSGGLGDDTFYVRDATDVVSENAAEGTDIVYASIDYTLTANVEDLTLTGTAVTGTGNTLDNVITGNAEDNTLDGGAGADTLNGGAGADTLNGGAGADILNGGVSNDTLDGGAGADTMAGNTGEDTYIVDDAGDIVTEAANEGIDSVQSSIDYTLGANVENLTLTGTATTGTGNTLDNVITGNALANTLDGGAGNDTLDGGAGADSMSGGAGNDVYYVDDAGDTVTEAGNSGTDTVYSSITYTLGSNVENLTLTGAANIDGTGTVGDDGLIGNDGDNVLSGGNGADSLTGGLGNDTLDGDKDNDTYYYGLGDGTDTIVENMGTDYLKIADFGDVARIYLNGNDLVFEMSDGGSITASNQLVNKNEIEQVDDVAGATSWTITNGSSGSAANDLLTGGAGADSFTGGAGDDIFLVDDASDTVTESAASGTDIVYASASHTLAANVENLTLVGAGAIDGTGNGLDNVILGNSAANTIDGGAGADTLTGGGGFDTLTGGAGIDTFAYVALTDGIDTVTDFTAGAGGEAVDLSALLTSVGYGGSDPFSDGWARLVGSGSDTFVQIDGDGGANSWTSIVKLLNVAPGDLTADNWVF